MDCKQLPDSIILDCLRGQAPAAVSTEVEKHIATCPACRGRAEEIRSLIPSIKRLAAATDASPGDATKARLLEAASEILRSRPTKSAERPRGVVVFRTAVRYAVAAAVLLVLWWLVDAMRGTEPRDHVAVASISDVEGPLRIERAPENEGAESHCLCRGDRIVVGEQPARFTYNNSFRVHLDPNSRLVVDADMDAKRAVLDLKQGQMRADGCQCNGEMRVMTCAGTVGSVGGEFTLRTDPEGKVHLAVHRGGARVHCPHCGEVCRQVQQGEAATLSRPASGCGGDRETKGGGCGCGR
ncbi:MAG: FecR domain-containing protein [Planctomycetota bacterium]